MSKLLIPCEYEELDILTVESDEVAIYLDMSESFSSQLIYLNKEKATLLRDKLNEFINK